MSEVQKPESRLSRQPAKDKPSRLYSLLLPVMRAVYATVLPVRYHGLENIAEQDAPFILMANHISMMDPFLMAVATPKHQIRFIGKKELWANKLVAWFCSSLKAIPVDRHNTDMEAMRACMRVTREGHVLGIFPEGTRHHKGTMVELESGVALIALRAGVPLIPIYIPGKVRLFRTLHVYIGEPITIADLREQGINTETCKALLTRITQTYAALEAADPNR